MRSVVLFSLQQNGVWNLCSDQVWSWLSFHLSIVYIPPQFTTQGPLCILLYILVRIFSCWPHCRVTLGRCTSPMFVWCGTPTWTKSLTSASLTCKWCVIIIIKTCLEVPHLRPDCSVKYQLLLLILGHWSTALSLSLLCVENCEGAWLQVWCRHGAGDHWAQWIISPGVPDWSVRETKGDHAGDPELVPGERDSNLTVRWKSFTCMGIWFDQYDSYSCIL